MNRPSEIHIISRPDAKKIGLKSYFTGKPCKRGHISERGVNTKVCRECSRLLSLSRREDHRAWREKNRNKLRDYSKAQKLKDIERSRLYQLRYREKNRESERQRKARWRKSDGNIQREKDYGKWWRENNRPITNAKAARRRAKLRMAEPWWSEKGRIIKIYEKASEYGMDVDHVVPIISDKVCGLHVWHNLQLLDKGLNSSKSNREWPDMW